MVVDHAPALGVPEDGGRELHRGRLRELPACGRPPHLGELVWLVGGADPVAAAVVEHAGLAVEDAGIVFLAEVGRARGVADATPAGDARTVGERFGGAGEPRIGGAGRLAARAGGFELTLIEAVEVAHQQPGRPTHRPIVSAVVLGAVGEGGGGRDRARTLIDERLVGARGRRHGGGTTRAVRDRGFEDEPQFVARIAPLGERRRIRGGEAEGAR